MNRLLSQEDAAKYCGLPKSSFPTVCPIAPIRLRAKTLWDRIDLDRWIDDLKNCMKAEKSIDDVLREI